MEVQEQIRRGLLACPITRKPISRRGAEVITDEASYPLIGEVPILVRDARALDTYARESKEMFGEYSNYRPESWLRRARAHDYRTRQSREALKILDVLNADTLGLSIGGGPKRIHPHITNVNIGPFPNVDVVGDAHELPYVDGCVDVIYCEAVLEHLHTPIKAVAEMLRVLKPGGRVYACTPFLQHYHGYPHHYQNFTLTGHQHLFRDFQIEEAGACVGPTYMLRAFVGLYFDTYLPRWLGIPLKAAWLPVSMLLAPLDLTLARHPEAHVMASTTYLVARKH